jgi:energy-coupling factor transporter ATP-binding protein EcfA2
MNPEVIVAYKPTALLDDNMTENVLELFREFVQERGILMVRPFAFLFLVSIVDVLWFSDWWLLPSTPPFRTPRSLLK